MPRGPKGEKRPADVIGAAIMVGKIASRRFILSMSEYRSRPKQKSETQWLPPRTLALLKAQSHLGAISGVSPTVPVPRNRVAQYHLAFGLREESSKLGSGGIGERGTVGSESGLVAACLFRVNTRPRKPSATKIAPAIISQCGKLIDESMSIYFPFAFSPISTSRRMASER